MYEHLYKISDKEKVASAILYDKNLNSIDDTAIIANRGSARIANEFIFTVFERFRAWADKPAIFGASNATRDKAQIMHKINEYNQNALKDGGKTVDVNAVAHSLGVSGDKNMLNWAAHLGQDYKHTKINFLHLGGSYPSEEIDQQAKSLFRNVNTEYIGVDGDWVYKGIFGSFIGNNPNATPANKLGFLKAHSDANQNINNLRFVEDDITKINDKSNVLKNIYQKTNGERIFNYIGYEK